MTDRPRRGGGAPRRPGFLLCSLLTITVLAGCGGQGQPAATPASIDGTTTSGAMTAPTVGELADRIGAAWVNVRTYRSVFTTSAHAPPSSPAPEASLMVVEIVDEAILPDRKHRVSRANGVVLSEFIATGGRVYARGPFVPGVEGNRADLDAWLLIDPANFDPHSQLGAYYGDLAAPVAAPYAALSPAERERDATPLGKVTVGGQTCAAYRIADTTMTGERIEVILALGPDDLPCSLETRAGGTVNRSVFQYNVPVTIEAPAAATPVVATPLASRGSP